MTTWVSHVSLTFNFLLSSFQPFVWMLFVLLCFICSFALVTHLCCIPFLLFLSTIVRFFLMLSWVCCFGFFALVLAYQYCCVYMLSWVVLCHLRSPCLVCTDMLNRVVCIKVRTIFWKNSTKTKMLEKYFNSQVKIEMEHNLLSLHHL